MYYDIKKDEHVVVKEGLPYAMAAFTSFASVSDRDLGGVYHTVIEHYDSGAEVINGNGAMVNGDCIIVHSGINEGEQQISETTNLDWIIISETLTSKPVSVPAGAYPVGYKDGSLYYVFVEGTKEKINRVTVEFEKAAKKEGLKLYYPPLRYCTDNAVMIASAGYYAYKNGDIADLDLNAYPALSL